MAYSIRLPDGTLVNNIPDDLDPAAAKAKIQASMPDLFKEQKPDESKQGFMPALESGYEGLKGNLALLGGKTGLMDTEKAQGYYEAQKKKAEDIFQPTQKSFTEAPLQNIKELVGQSLPYMAAPLAGAVGAAALPEAAGLGAIGSALGLGAADVGAFGLNAAQFAATNLGRQVDEGKKLADTSLVKAGLAAVPQAALDVWGMHMIPGIRQVFGAAGAPITESVAERIAKNGLLSTAGDIAMRTGKVMGAEGLNEAGQQFFERLQAGLNVTDADARKEYYDNFIGGAVLGGVMAPIGAHLEGAQAGAKPGAPGATTEKEQELQDRRLQLQQEQVGALQGKQAREGEKLIDQEEAAKIAQDRLEKSQAEKDADEQMKALRAKREEELKQVFPADYSDVMQRADAYSELLREKNSLVGQRKTAEVKARLATIDQRMTEMATEDMRVPQEAARRQKENASVIKQLPPELQAKIAARPFESTKPQQMEMREATVEQPNAPPQATQAAPIAEEEAKPLTAKELEDQGQMRLPFGRKTQSQTVNGPITKAEQTTPQTEAETETPAQTQAELPLEPVSEPKKFVKAEAPTPDQLPTKVTPDVLGALGIGRTALIRKDDHPIMGKDITDPTQAEDVRRILEGYKQGRSQGIQDKIDAYLARPEFQGEANVGQTEPGPSGESVSIPSGPEPKVEQTSAGTTESEPTRVVPPRQDVNAPTGREGPPPTPVNPFAQLIKADAKDQEFEEAPVVAIPKVKNAFESIKGPSEIGAQLQAEAKSEKELAADLKAAAQADRMAREEVKNQVDHATLEAGIDKLEEPQVAKLESHYNADRNSPEFWTQLQKDVVGFVNKGATAVHGAIRAIIKKVAEGVLAVAVIFNPNFTTNTLPINLPQVYKQTSEIRTAVPESAKKVMSPLAQRVYENMAATATKTGKGFFIADKPNGMIHIFNADGTHFLSDASLYGKDIGDKMGASSLVGGPKITPAGKFTLQVQDNDEYVGKKALALVESEDEYHAFVAIHAAWLGDAKEHREQRLKSPNPAEHRISYGCINTDHKTFLGKLLPRINDFNGGLAFVLPDNTAATDTYFPAQTKTTETVSPNATKESPTSVYGKEEGLPPTKNGRASVTPTMEGQSFGSLQDRVESGKGLLAGALRNAVKNGLVVLADKHPSGERIGGYYDGQKVTLYADGIPKGHEIAVALHEIGAHLGFKNLFGQRVHDNIIKNIQELAMSKQPSLDRTLAQRALGRIPQIDIERGPEVYGDETLAYFIEEAAKAEASGELPTVSPLRAIWNGIKTAVLAAINRVFGSRLGVKDLTPNDILNMAKGAFVKESYTGEVNTNVAPDAGRFSRTDMGLSPAAIADINSFEASFGVAAPEVGGLINESFKGATKAFNNGSLSTTFRQAVVDKYASIESKVSEYFSKGVRDSFGNLNPMVLVRQADEHARLFMDFIKSGGIRFNKDGMVESFKHGSSVQEALKQIQQLAKDSGIPYAEAKDLASKVFIGHREMDIRKNHNDVLEQSARLLEANGKLKEADAERAKKIKLFLTNAEQDRLEQIYNSTPALQKIQNTFNETRAQALDFLAESGRISKETADDWKANGAYVPFDRILEDFGHTTMFRGKGLAVMSKDPKIKGSMEKPVGNVIDSYMNTLGWMVEEGMRHNAAVKTLGTMELAGLAKSVPTPEAATNKNLVVPKLFKDGKPLYFEVENENDLAAFIQAPEMMNWAIKALAATAKGLRVGVTALPPFAVKQVVEDASRAMMYSGVQRPFVVGAKTLYNLPRAFFGELTGRKSPAVRRMEELGIIGDFDFNIVSPASDLEKEIGAKKRGVAGSIYHLLEKFTKASDLASRQAVYEETMQESGGDEVLAQHRARELINFSRRGTSSTMRVLSRTIPFFNAYAQGLDVLYRAASGIDSTSGIERNAARNLFRSRMAMMMAFGFMYAWSMYDDKGYEDATDDVRDNNWLLPGGYKIPTAKELGFIYKTIPERVVQYMRRSGTPEEQSAGDALTGLLKSALSAYGSPNTVPSTIRPILEDMTNYSFYLQRPLESASMQAKEPGQRFDASTSELAKRLGESLNMSPIKIDNLMRGWFGMGGSTGLLITDAVLNPTRPDRPAYQLPFGSIFLYNTEGSRPLSEFYDLHEKAAQAVTTYNSLKQTNPEKAQEFLEKRASLIGVAPVLNSTLEQLTNMRRMRNFLEQGSEEDLGVSSAERRKMIDELKGYENDSTRYIRELEAEIRKE